MAPDLTTDRGTDRILIVGAGQAGATAALALREQGHAGELVLCGSESHAPYERPPLTKNVLADPRHEETIGIHAVKTYTEHAIDLRLGVTVTSIDADTRTACLSDGQSLAFRSCLLATGGQARRVAGLPESPRLHTIRTLDDSRRLRDVLRAPSHLLVIGGGFLGLEVASTARAAGWAVTLVESADRLLARAVPPEFSGWLAARCQAMGIALSLGVTLEDCAVDADGVRVTLRGPGVDDRAGGIRQLAASHCVIAVGLVPDVALARDAGIDIDAANGGIRVDAACATSAPGIYAAGDCASQHRPFFGSVLRMESWQNANDQAKTAAAAMLGLPLPAPPVPWFWTDALDWNIQIYGGVAPALHYQLRGPVPVAGEPGKFLLLGSRDGVLLHAVAVNAGGDLRQLKPLFDTRTPCDVTALADIGRPLRSLVRDALAAHPISS